MKTFSGVIALVVITAGATRTEAQANPDSVKIRDNCRLAMQAVTTGHPGPKLQWAYPYLRICDPADRQTAALAAVSRLRTSHDVPEIVAAVEMLAVFHDGQLFNAVLALAGDNGASNEARVDAFVALQRVIVPSGLASYGRFSAGIDSRGLPLSACFALRRVRWTVS